MSSEAATATSPEQEFTPSLTDERTDAFVEEPTASETPEADRLFAPPTPEEAAHALRELEWGEQIIGTRMAAARGNAKTYIYSLQEAATFFFDVNSGSATLLTKGAFAWINIDEFVNWFRDVIGDKAFADVLGSRLAEKETYNEKIELLRQLLMLRYSQYVPYLPQDEEGVSTFEEPTQDE